MYVCIRNFAEHLYAAQRDLLLCARPPTKKACNQRGIKEAFLVWDVRDLLRT